MSLITLVDYRFIFDNLIVKTWKRGDDCANSLMKRVLRLNCILLVDCRNRQLRNELQMVGDIVTDSALLSSTFYFLCRR